MPGAGALIWSSFRPLLRLFLCVSTGFALTKAELFPVQAARGAGQIMLNIALPCLMFSRIVPAFSSDNISALGPLVLVAFIYEAIGIMMAWAIKQVFWVPHRFRYGMLVAGGWGNVGDIPTSVVMSITAVSPFNGTADENLSVAYISAFILVFFVTFFPMGGNRLVAMDYVGPDVEPEEVREILRLKQRRLLLNATARLRNWKHPFSSPVLVAASREKASDPESRPHSLSQNDAEEPKARTDSKVALDGDDLDKKELMGEFDASGECSDLSSPAIREKTLHNRMPSMNQHVSFSPQDDGTTIVPPQSDAALASRYTSPAPTITHVDQSVPPPAPNPTTVPAFTSESSVSRATGYANRTRLQKMLSLIRSFIIGIFTPASLSIIIAFPIALITPVKSLFTPTTFTGIPNAPDGDPPLAFILDTATFMGNASVPLGLVCLGSALARLKIPSFRRKEEWEQVPKGAIVSLAIGKMVISPVLGVCIVRGLTGVGIVNPEDKVLQFVCIFLSCLPTATTQVFITQVYSGTGSAEHLSPFLIPQYIIMFITMTALTAYTLQLLF